ncbi:MAG TPA: epoxide hydrolase N-terminal domain-containing protein, partial [Gammaproteobacteria bacterium]|nr:epoxide hydrolase N-terminal domain-containing protein [Gammaproteobacteria bacterium]
MNKTTTLRAGIGFKLLFIVIMFATPSSAKFYNATLRVDSSASPNNSSLREATMTSGQSRFAAAETAIVPFEISVSDQDILDLKQRLSRTRLPDQIANTSWEYGMNIRYLTDLLDYWENDYDWREQETMLNQFDQFKTSIEGLDLHFIHQLSENPNAIPLMVVHGWPGSISEFTKIIGPLTDPVAYG